MSDTANIGTLKADVVANAQPFLDAMKAVAAASNAVVASMEKPQQAAQKTTSEFEKLRASLGSGISSAVEGAGTALAGLGTAALAGVAGVAALGTKIIELGNQVDSGGALSWAESMGKFKDAAANAAANLATQLRPAFEAVMGVVTKMLSFISRIDFGKVIDDIKGVLAGIWNGFTGFISKMADGAVMLAKIMMTPYQMMKDFFFESLAAMLEKMADVADKAKKFGVGPGGGTMRIAAEGVRSAGGGNLVDGILGGLKESFSFVADTFSKNAKGIKDAAIARWATKPVGTGHVYNDVDAAEASQKATGLEVETQILKLKQLGAKAEEQAAIAALGMTKEGAQFATQQAEAQLGVARQKLSQATYGEFDAAMAQVVAAQKAVDIRQKAQADIAAKELDTAQKYAATLAKGAEEAKQKAFDAAEKVKAFNIVAITETQQKELEAAKKVAAIAMSAAQDAGAKQFEAAQKVSSLLLDTQKQQDAAAFKAQQDRIDLQKAASEHANAVQNLGKDAVTGLVTGSGGSLASVTTAALKGSKEGGGEGAIVEAVVALLSETKQFKDIISMVNDIVSAVGQALGYLLVPFQPIIAVAKDLLAPVLALLGPALMAVFLATNLPIAALAAVAGALGMLFQVVQPITDVFMQLGSSLMDVTPILSVISGVLHNVYGPSVQKVATELQYVGAQLGNAFAPFLVLFGQMLTDVAQMMAPLVLDGLKFLIGSVVEVSRALLWSASLLDQLGYNLAFWLSGIARDLGQTNLADDLKAMGDTLKTAKYNADVARGNLANAFENGPSPSTGSTGMTNQSNTGFPGLDDNTGATKENTKATRDAVSAMTNVPQGFKLALERYRATNGNPSSDVSSDRYDPRNDPNSPDYIPDQHSPTTTRSMHRGHLGGGSSGDGFTVNGNIYVSGVQDLPGLLKQIEEAAKRKHMNLTGSVSQFHGSPMATRSI